MALFGRASLLSAIEARLCAGGGVSLHGPEGIGKSALLDVVAAAAAARGELVVRLRSAQSERLLPYAGIADLVEQLPPAAVAALSPAHRAALTGLRRGSTPRAGAPALARRLVLPGLLAFCARSTPVLLVLDDVQWLDTESAGLIGFAMRRGPGQRVRVVAAQRQPGEGGSHRAARLCPAPVTDLVVPPLDADDLTAMLEAHGLPCRTASRLHEASGGNPFLALTLGGAVAPGPAWRPAPLPEPVRALLRRRLDALPPGVTGTLLVAALATEPLVTTLVRAGYEDAARDLRTAAEAGVVAVDGDSIRFTPPALAAVLAEDAGAARRAGVHDALADATLDETVAVRHRALRSGRPDADVARDLVAAAERALARSAGRTAAELYLLAADRCPRSLAAERFAWLVAAAGTGATAGAPEIAGRAAEAVLAAVDAPAVDRVRARVVLLDLAGQALADMGETFAAALHEAGADPALLAPVLLRQTWAAFLTGDADTAAARAAASAQAARTAGDTATEAMALSALAQVQRLRGEPEWRRTLHRAVTLPAPLIPGWLHLSPRYAAARFAMMDDRIEEARAELLALCAVAEQDRTGEALVEVLRSLSEVATRAGRCRDALQYAHRAVAAAARAGLSPGPTWYTAAVAELAGGSLAAAAGYARRGVRASEQEGDGLYLRRNLHALGQAELRAGDARSGVAALRRLRDLGGANDPMIVRWQGDLAAGLATLGEHDEAAATLHAARQAAERLGAGPALDGYLDRAAAMVLSESGEADSAVRLSESAAQRFQGLHQPLEQAHALLVQGGAERRRRRYAAARVAIGAALAIFLAADAKPWMEQTERALARTEGTTAPPADQGLTGTEARIAGLVRDGASNREIAAQLFLSVKTVEATLTRVYRKLGVRSRTQLSRATADRSLD
ncbi:LuxR family transcriptional regulator [Actinoplanes sp. N902-109]|uniref:helix-turn-helix transcriptional regulator n=1 Tax=Actinoplanes sp. (strain N902-109) TaxID=649831 RepID=UPI0003295068|nr:LuxR family transcriptional regulator [Actinoplanes sp. N902-109]AGL18283.1 putative transcriptional regulator [Actinoplanes sp. N902-109]